MAALFPSDVHSGLRSLLTKLLLSNLPEWRDSLLASAVGPAKLVACDWRADVKASSNHAAAMAVPTVLVDIKVATTHMHASGGRMEQGTQRE